MSAYALVEVTGLPDIERGGQLAKLVQAGMVARRLRGPDRRTSKPLRRDER